LVFDQWDDKTTGQKRSKHKIVVEALQLLDPKQDGQGGPRSAGASAPARAAAGAPRGPEEQYDEPAPNTGEEIPF
jgi:single-strand DNA-binding protein